MIDAPAIVHEFLTRAGTALSLKVGDRVWTPVAPSNWDNETTAIVYQQTGSNSIYSGATYTATFTFKCFGGDGNYGPEHTVFQALYDRLHSASENAISGGIRLGKLITDYPMLIEPITNYKSHTAIFDIMFEGTE